MKHIVKFLPSITFLIFLIGLIVFVVYWVKDRNEESTQWRNKEDSIWIWVFFFVILVGLICSIYFIYKQDQINTIKNWWFGTTPHSSVFTVPRFGNNNDRFFGKKFGKI